MNAITRAKPHYNAVFLSDLHLGMRGCRCDFLADFLGSFTTNRLYLVGDILDIWRLRKSFYWDAMHDEVVRLILDHARAGTDVTYLPGNHDEMLRAWLAPGLEVGGVQFTDECEHVTAAGQRLLIMHGDQFDSVVRYARFLALLGDHAYNLAILLNTWLNNWRRRLGYPYWSLSQWAKRQVKEAVKAIDRFENALSGEARRRGYDGVVCGHIHQPEMRQVEGVLYLNTGDWVESCTALVEQADGTLRLIDWAAENRLSFFEPRRVAVAAPA